MHFSSYHIVLCHSTSVPATTRRVVASVNRKTASGARSGRGLTKARVPGMRKDLRSGEKLTKRNLIARSTGEEADSESGLADGGPGLTLYTCVFCRYPGSRYG